MLLQILPRSYSNYLSLPLFGQIIQEFTSWFFQRGYTLGTIRNKIYGTKSLDNLFQKQNIQSFDELSRQSLETAKKHFQTNKEICRTIQWLETFLIENYGLLPDAEPSKTSITIELDNYAKCLKDIRGFADKTIKSHRKYIQDFLQYLDYNNHPDSLRLLTSKQIDDFICIMSQKMNRFSLQHVVGYLRAFLRQQYEQGVLKTPIHTMIDTPRVYRLEQLPRSIPREKVKKLLASVERISKQGIRDYTVLFLTASYGLRASEIASITLDHVFWKTGVIHISQSKGKKKLSLPLTEAVGEVLIEYLRKGRPVVSHRELFVSARAPYRPLKSTTVNEIFKSRVRKSGLTIQYGIHSLRHAYAEHLLRQGNSVKAIGDLLGHSNLESTGVYLRLAIEDLRCVPLPLPQKFNIAVPENLILEHYLRKTGNHHKFDTERGKPKSLNSYLAESITDYIQLKKSLGREFRDVIWIFHSFDAFLVSQYPDAKDLTPKVFNDWCSTLYHLSPTVRRNRMRNVRNLCLYRARTHPQTFIPDLLTFPQNHQPIVPYIFSELDVCRLMMAAHSLSLHPAKNFGLRSETMRLAILLLYTTGLRRGELLKLQLFDFDQQEMTLLIRESKFHKSRIIPLSLSVAEELKTYLNLRSKGNYPMEPESPIIWNGLSTTNPGSYAGSAFGKNLSALCNALKIYTSKNQTPRVHDLRHSFACRVLQKWYQHEEDVQAKLPFLSLYMGHVSIDSTYYYLRLVEETSLQISTRFYESFRKDLTNRKPCSKLFSKEEMSYE